jgi:hypothetical protein
MLRLGNALAGIACLVAVALLAACYTRSEIVDRPGEIASTAPASSAGGLRQPAAGLRFSVPPEWISEPPSSGMRQAQYRLPRAEGDPEDAELVVFYFQGEGGSAQANIDRWVGQFQKPDGSAASGEVSSRKSNGVPLTIVDVSGVYTGGGPMMQPSAPKAGFRMLAAVAETASGPWFFKLTGPAKTVARWQSGFSAFLDTIR